MSQYVTIQVKVTDKQAALSALRILGFDGGTVITDDAGAIQLLDWHGKVVPDALCHIAVSQNDIEMPAEHAQPRNDFGIDLRTGQVWIDGAVKTHAILGRFVQEYAVQVAMRFHEAQGRKVRRVDDPETGKVHVYAD